MCLYGKIASNVRATLELEAVLWETGISSGLMLF